jgi:hypothetical protein
MYIRGIMGKHRYMVYLAFTDVYVMLRKYLKDIFCEGKVQPYDSPPLEVLSPRRGERA